MSYNGATTFCLDVYGQGQDGALTIASGTTTVLAKDMYYSTLIVNGTLITANYVVYCLALGGTGIITNSGAPGVGMTGGINLTTGTWPAAANGLNGVITGA